MQLITLNIKQLADNAERGLSINQTARVVGVSQTYIIHLLKQPEYKQLAEQFKLNGTRRQTKYHTLTK
jgi:hypothetical protein